jgi:molybdate transport system permease protein
VPGIILPQWMVARAFAVRTMRTTFDQISPRQEQGADPGLLRRAIAFWQIVLPQGAARAWLAVDPRLGPGPRRVRTDPDLPATVMRTEVMPTSVFLELSAGISRPRGRIALMVIAVSFWF